MKSKEEVVIADGVVKNCHTKGEFYGKLHLLEHHNHKRRNAKYDSDDSKDSDDDEHKEAMVKLREEIEKGIAKEREENWNKYQRKLESNFEKEFESLVVEGVRGSDGHGTVKTSNINIPHHKGGHGNSGGNSNSGTIGVAKREGMKLLLRGKNNKIETRAINLKNSSWDAQRDKKKERDKLLLDEEV
jgi:hypothetical protein